jgi:ABC-type Fe3+ transport system permease subunit
MLPTGGLGGLLHVSDATSSTTLAGVAPSGDPDAGSSTTVELSGTRHEGRWEARRLSWGKLGLRAAAAGYLLLMVALPLLTIAREGLVARAALALTLETALAMTVVNAVMGTLIAYVLVRYRFPGRKLLDVVIDLPSRSRRS